MFRGVPRCFEVFRTVPRRSEAFRGLGTPRNTSEHLGRPRAPRLKRGRLLPPLVAGMLKSGSPRPPESPEVFRGVPRCGEVFQRRSEAFRGGLRPRNTSGGVAFAAVSGWNAYVWESEASQGVPRCSEASERLETPRNTSEHLGRFGLPDLSIPGTNGGGAAFATVSGWNA